MRKINKGFTLVEILLVVMIGAILLSLIFYTYKQKTFMYHINSLVNRIHIVANVAQNQFATFQGGTNKKTIANGKNYFEYKACTSTSCVTQGSNTISPKGSFTTADILSQSQGVTGIPADMVNGSNVQYSIDGKTLNFDISGSFDPNVSGASCSVFASGSADDKIPPYCDPYIQIVLTNVSNATCAALITKLNGFEIVHVNDTSFPSPGSGLPTGGTVVKSYTTNTQSINIDYATLSACNNGNNNSVTIVTKATRVSPTEFDVAPSLMDISE